MKLEVRKIGNSCGVILPKQLIDKLHIKEGDVVYALDTEAGITLTAYDPKFDKVMKTYEIVSSKYRNALKELAK